MTKICETCKYFRAGLGKCGTGICISDKSLKKNKNCTLRSETCKKWERRTNE
jgi:hypothetical protein